MFHIFMFYRVIPHLRDEALLSTNVHEGGRGMANLAIPVMSVSLR